jgi:hypothetical protein
VSLEIADFAAGGNQETKMLKVWEKYKGETPRAYEVFCRYRDSGYNEKGERQARPSLLEFSRLQSGYNLAAKNRSGSILRWSRGIDFQGRPIPSAIPWSERVAAYDEYMEERDRARREEEILRRRAQLREMAWQRTLLGLENVENAIRGLRQIIGLPERADLPTSEAFQSLFAKDRRAILDVLGRLAQHELDKGEAAARADVDMVTERQGQAVDLGKKTPQEVVEEVWGTMLRGLREGENYGEVSP